MEGYLDYLGFRVFRVSRLFRLFRVSGKIGIFRRFGGVEFGVRLSGLGFQASGCRV